MHNNKYIYLGLIFLMSSFLSNSVSAELKMGIVNLDNLFKQIPIYR